MWQLPSVPSYNLVFKRLAHAVTRGSTLEERLLCSDRQREPGFSMTLALHVISIRLHEGIPGIHGRVVFILVKGAVCTRWTQD